MLLENKQFSQHHIITAQRSVSVHLVGISETGGEDVKRRWQRDERNQCSMKCRFPKLSERNDAISMQQPMTY
uniref:Uncharacterized protein n=1 Tax=Timema cristinae TaxID=61476 RepID=A0A7R9CUA7_TIMCR|nr:unnamed protein product [Timema cristinae]